MNSSVTGQHQRATGLKLNRALKFTTLLAICIWLIYQISQPHDKSSASKFTEQQSMLRCKANIRWFVPRNESDPKGQKIINKSKNWEGHAGDYQIAKSQEEKANKHLKEISGLVYNKDDQRNFEVQRKDLHGGSDGDDTSSFNMERREKLDSLNVGYQDSRGNFIHSSQENVNKEAEIDEKKPDIDVETQSRATEGKDKDTLSPDRTDNDNPWQHGAENGLGGVGFDDENGVPLGLTDVAEVNGTE